MSGPPPVVIKYLVAGLDDVLKSMRSIQDVVAQTERKSVNAAKAAVSEKRKIAEKAAKDQVAAVVRAEQMSFAAMSSGFAKLGKLFQNQARIRERSATMAGAFAKKEADREIREREQADRRLRAIRERSATMAGSFAKSEAARERSIRERSANMAGALAKKQASEETKMLRQLAVERNRLKLEARYNNAPTKPSLSVPARRELLDSAKGKSPEEQQKILDKAKMLRQEAQLDRQARKRKQAEEDAAQKDITKKLAVEEERRRQIRERSAKMAGDFAKKQAAEEAAARKQADKELTQTRKQFGQTVFTGASKGVSAAYGIAGTAARSVMNIGGGFSLEDSLQREVAFTDEANAIATKTQTGISQKQIENQARALAVSQGLDKSEVLKAYDQVTKLNDDALPMAMAAMPDIAKIAAVTGTSMQDMGGLAANITAANPKITQPQLTRQLRVMARQGIEGGVEVADFAKYGSRITAGSVYFGSENTELHEAKLGMSAQVARQFGGANGAAESTLAAQRFAEDLNKKKGHLASMGVDVSDKKGNLREIDDLLVEMISKNSKISDIPEFKIGERGNKVLLGASKLYQDAGGGAAGERAIREKFGAANATKDMKDGAAGVEKKFAQRMTSTSKQLAVNMEKLRNEVGIKLLPVLNEFIPVLASAIPVFSKALSVVASFADVVAKNPLTGLAAIIGGSIALEVGKAQLARVFESAISTKMGSGALAITSAMMTITAAKLFVDTLAKAENDRQKMTSDATLAGLNSRGLVKNGIQTPEDFAKAKETTNTLKTSMEANKDTSSATQLATAVAGGLLRDMFTFGLAGGTKSVVEANKAGNVGANVKEMAEQKAIYDSLTASMKKFEESAKSAAAQQSAQPSPDPHPVAVRTQPIPKRSAK